MASSSKKSKKGLDQQKRIGITIAPFLVCIFFYLLFFYLLYFQFDLPFLFDLSELNRKWCSLYLLRFVQLPNACKESSQRSSQRIRGTREEKEENQRRSKANPQKKNRRASQRRKERIQNPNARIKAVEQTAEVYVVEATNSPRRIASSPTSC